MSANLFDANFYRSTYKDLAALSDSQALSHFQTFGIKEGRLGSLFFDPTFYKSSNSDLASLNGADLLNHAQNFGVKEGRRTSAFVDLNFYVSANKDLQQAFGSDREKALQHLQTFGLNEKRQFSQFVNLDYYSSNNSDINKAFGGEYTKTLQHLETFGIKENRQFSKFFSADYYLKNNADVNTAVKGDIGKALQHFETFGVNEGRKGNVTFDANYYRSKYSDLQAAKLSNAQLFDHFQAYGQAEGRQASPFINVPKYQHVLMLSIDGLRESDLIDPNLKAYLPNIASLAQGGVSYSNANTINFSDSFPGELALLTGAGPKTTGVFYDDSYARGLIPAGGTSASPLGTEVYYSSNINKDATLINGGGSSNASSIDPKLLPIDPATGKPVYPHNYLKVNTIFEVAKAAGLNTAYADKHPSYELANGPSGTGVDDLYTPEIDAVTALENGKLVDKSTAVNKSLTFVATTSSVKLTEANDDLKVAAILNQIAGKNSTGTSTPGTPGIFGMNFQAVSVGQKLPTGGINPDGTARADFSDSLQHTDQSIGQIISALKHQGLFDSTLVVLTAKHGQNPRVGPGIFIGDVLTPALTAAGVTVAQATEDDVAQIWLKDQSQTAKAAAALVTLAQTTPADGIDTVYSGASLVQAGFGNPLTDGRAPDIVVKMRPGFVLSTSKKKQSEHGGLAPDDTNVALILDSGSIAANMRGTTKTDPVFTTQVATTVLQALGLDPNALQGVQAEKTQALPGMNFFA
jgi:Type I phosphodiesterase / nucleotide pyrophosphatase